MKRKLPSTPAIPPGMARYSMNLVVFVPEASLMPDSYMRKSIEYALIKAVKAASADDPFSTCTGIEVMRLSAVKEQPPS